VEENIAAEVFAVERERIQIGYTLSCTAEDQRIILGQQQAGQVLAGVLCVCCICLCDKMCRLLTLLTPIAT
jgi:hypothetical protein